MSVYINGELERRDLHMSILKTALVTDDGDIFRVGQLVTITMDDDPIRVSRATVFTGIIKQFDEADVSIDASTLYSQHIICFRLCKIKNIVRGEQ